MICEKQNSDCRSLGITMSSSLCLQFPWQLLQQIFAETNNDLEELKFHADINGTEGVQKIAFH